MEVRLERPRLRHHEALGREHVLHFARPDPEGQRAERAVRRGMRVAAHDHHAGLGGAELGADHVHDPLVGRAQVEQLDAEIARVRGECLELPLRDGVVDGKCPVAGGDVVVHGGEREIGPSHPPPRPAQAAEGLGRRHFVHQVQVHVQQRRPVAELVHDVGLPHLGEQGARSGRPRHRAAAARVVSGAERSGFAAARALPSSDQGIMARSFAPTRSIR